MKEILQKGTNSQEVRRLQELLNSILDPSPNLKMDGVFGFKTEAAVKRFQTLEKNLKIDGIVGPKTWAALETGQNKIKYHLPDVFRIQQILNTVLSPSPNLKVDGIFGPKTEVAVKRFQGIVGLKVDGIVGPQTWAALEPGQTGLQHHKDSPRQSDSSSDAPWMEVARREVGTSEIPGVRHNARILQYHKTTTLQARRDEIAWCSSFVNWCLQQVAISGTRSAAAASWLNWGQRSQARSGAITIIHNPAAANTRLSRSGNHVAFLMDESRSHYILLGGNQSDQVRISSYPKSRWQLKGYRWPNRFF